MASGLVSGLQQVGESIKEGLRSHKLNILTSSQARDVYDVCLWLMKAENSEENVRMRIINVLNAGDEITGIQRFGRIPATVSEDRVWPYFVDSVCRAVDPDYQENILNTVHTPDRHEDSETARQTAFKIFGVLKWLVGLFPEIQEIVGTGRAAEKRLLFKSLSAELEKTMHPRTS